ncbi:MAG: hypothetical protein QOI82_1674 [Actinomycetota bacterium]|jgi:hypothetical protein|nr:hypothetical protein [Actinomycetota bacterium]
MKLTSRRSLAAFVGVAAATALSASVLAAVPASAGNASRIIASTTAIQGAAGTCTLVSYSFQDQFGDPSTKADSLTVTLDENPESANQDVDFCNVPGVTAPTEEPSYVAGDDDPTGNGPTTQRYVPGPGVTGNGFSSGDNPDTANDDSQTASSPLLCDPCTDTNPSGEDRARYAYSGNKVPITIGVVGLIPGGATIHAFFDEKHVSNPITGSCAAGGDYTSNCSETKAADVAFKITDGGQPGANDTSVAVATIDLQPTDSVGAPGATQQLTATLRNSSGDTVRGVTPRAQVNSSGANPLASPTCTQSDNNGVSTCTFKGTNPGTDQLTVWVQRAGGTAGIDGNEVSRTVTVRTTFNPVAASEARYIDMAPRGTTIVAGKPATFTATITDVNGAPAQGVSVVFTESGPGQFTGGGSSVSATTDATGRAFVVINTVAGAGGTQTVTGTINTPNTQCTQLQGSGNGSTASTPAGRCADTTNATITGSTPTPTPSSPSPSGGRRALSLSTPTPDIQPTDDGILNASGQPNASVELRCYTRPTTSYSTARGPVNLSSSGALQFTIHPGANTRCYVRYAGDETSASPSVVINVHTTLSLSAYRDGVRKYHFQGTNLPRRAGQLITLYRWARRDNNGYCDPQIAAGDYTASSNDPNCVAVRTATATTNSSNVWRIDRSFTGSGQFVFQVRTSQTLTNAAGVSNPRLTIIH